MGPAKSRISADPPRRKEVQCLVDLNPLPDELLLLILSRVPARALVTRCRLVCRRWKRLIDTPTVWKLQWERDPSLRAALRAASRHPQLQWGRVSVLRPLGRNLIKNPCGKEEFQHWSIQPGGDGWCVEENKHPVEGAEAQTCFVSSYDWCIKSQLIDLLQEGFWEDLLDNDQPEILISDWWGPREDCGCVYAIHVSLLAGDRRSVIADFKSSLDPIPQWNDAQYQQVSHSFRRYGPGVRYVHFQHRGKDTQFWAGHYGARVTNSTVRVEVSPEPP